MRRAATFALAIAAVGATVLVTAPNNAPRIDADGFPAEWRPALERAPAATASAPQPLTAPALPPPSKVASGDGAVRVFSPGQPLLAPAPTTPVAPQAAAALPQPATATPARRLASSRPADEDARRELVRDLQAELKRVGCYEGELSGNWSPASKRAMRDFVERVNATLPLDEPDFILLTLVQGHSGQACGQSCPNGQGLGADGKCVPRAVLATAASRRDAAQTALETNPATIVPPKPKLATRPAAKVAGGWSTVVTPPPATKSAETQPAGESQAGRQPSPVLPGRMAIGAPIPAEPARAETEAARVDLAKRKADLAAAQADAGSDLARKVRRTEAQARIEQERALRSKQPAAKTNKPPVVAALPEPTSTISAAPTSDGRTKAPVARKVARPDPVEGQRKVPTLPPMAGPGQIIVMLPPPARAPQPRVVQSYPQARPAAAPSYTPQPMRWSRTIFTDIERTR